MGTAHSELGERKREAIQTQSERAGQFAESYVELKKDPFRDCFVYSRHRLKTYLDKYISQEGSGLKLLDVGCGTGDHMAELRKSGYEVVGVDISEEMLSFARQNNPASLVIRADVDDIPLPNETFDMIISIEVLRHLPRSENCIREIGRLLKPGGRCLVTATPTLNLNGYTLINKIANAVQIGDLARHRQAFHTSARIKREFTKAGFSSVEIHGVYVGPVNWIGRLANRALPTVLKAWEPFDAVLCDKPVLKELSNMFLIKAVK